MAPVLDTTKLLLDLEPVVEENLNRHLAAAKEWMPHEYVPWSQGRDFADLGGEDWDVEQSQLSPIARTALEVNLLTEAARAPGAAGCIAGPRRRVGTPSASVTTSSSPAALIRSPSSDRAWRSCRRATTAARRLS